jgi:folate-binding protein YgfZ
LRVELFKMPLETPLLALHEAAGATLGEYFGVRLPSRFGDFGQEYAALRRSVALVDTNFRAFFAFTGPDRQRYLNALLTSNVRDLKPGQGTLGLLLTPQGHILAEIEALACEDRILAVSHAMVRERIYSTFEKFIIMDDVTLEDITPVTGTLDLMGPRTEELLVEAGQKGFADWSQFASVETQLAQIPCRIIRREIGGHPAATLIVPVERLGQLWRTLAARVRGFGGTTAGMEALNSVRLEFGMPWFGYDFDDKHIPHEAGLEHSHISYEKGCYTGQEIVERVRSRGQVNRRLVEMQFSGSTAPPAGTKVLQDGKETGEITSAGYSPSLGRAIGLGYVRREQSALGTRLDASGTPAEVIAPPLLSQKTSA